MRLYFFCLCLLMFVQMKAQENTIPFLDETIEVDGKLDETVWQGRTAFGGFHNFFPNDVGKAESPTEVRLFHNGKNLYISVVYTDGGKEIVSSLKRDDYGGAVVESDCFQLVIDAFNKKNNGYFFSVNTSNTQVDALISFDGSDYSLNMSWSAIWKSSVGTEGDKKIYEFEIPLKVLGYKAGNNEWGINFISRNLTPNNWMSFTDMSRNYIQYDLRTTATFTIEQLPNVSASKFIVTPSATYNYQENTRTEENNSTFKPSLDAQYSITPSLKLDATINPDFSQIDVDQQVTNLTRFAVNFPERRNFFIENSDLFANLGTNEVNPFYSRRIGATNDILFGAKLSGNITPKTRVGILNVQTDEDEDNQAQNYGALVLQQQLFKTITTTAFLVNRQQTQQFDFQNDFNRVAGLNINYRSKDNKWTGLANLGKSFTNGVSKKRAFNNLGVKYTTRKVGGELSVSSVGENYLTDIGFVPRLYNYDAVNNQLVREGYRSINGSLSLNTFPKAESIQMIRYLRLGNATYTDESGTVTQSSTFTNHAIFFKSSASAYVSLDHAYVNLKYGFDPLQNGNSIVPGIYRYASARVGYNSAYNKKISFRTALQQGSYYKGSRTRYYFNSTYRFLPAAKIGLNYEVNYLDLKTLGQKTFHLLGFTGEVFFNNRLNWTTYVQYNTQRNNLNVNSRLQWEYKPLSYMYLVVTDNFDQHISRTNWGIAFKMNYRFEF